MMSTTKYSSSTIWIHWVSALLIFGVIFTGIQMEELAHSEEKFNLYKVHFALGFVVFILTIWRTILLLKPPRPTPLYEKGSKHQRLISFVHYGFYITILWMCISGIVSLSLEGILPALKSGSFSDLPDIRQDGFHPIMLSHHIVAKLVFLLLLFHIGGVVLHFIRKKENALKRIWK